MKLKYPSQFPTYSYLASPDETEKEGPSALQPAHILAICGNAAIISSDTDHGSCARLCADAAGSPELGRRRSLTETRKRRPGSTTAQHGAREARSSCWLPLSQPLRDGIRWPTRSAAGLPELRCRRSLTATRA
ncbi:hypothetical protein PVAP13_8NG061802 [Panicum virgatum]|uniref:Uncharacterized protein n=1 Tax=Panicum virgatum TaxID=38727 RepID=A0A8T0P1R1_PANVG|nr:hypothetical protein PVAP13_8NG061802 [Panicum virgatum]